MAEHADGYGYSRFCDLYRDWRKTDLGNDAADAWRRREAVRRLGRRHGAGLRRRDRDGAARPHLRRGAGSLQLHLRRGPLERGAAPTGSAPTSTPSPTSAACPRRVVCDNLKAGRHGDLPLRARHQPHLPGIWPTHYDTAILPTRPRKPRDKAKVEVGVLIVERYVLARLRNRRFFSLFELNAAIREIVADLNARIMRKLGVSRNELLETVERPALKALPSEPYQYAEWKKCRVAPDYHVEVERHYYSVPSRLIREEVEARITDSTVEIFHKGDRVASHARTQRAQSPYDGSRAHAELRIDATPSGRRRG